MKLQRFLSGLLVACTIIGNIPLTLAEITLKPFSDVELSSPYIEAITFIKAKGIISGYPDGTFKPDQVVNRAESLKMILGIKDLKYWSRAEDGPIFAGADTYEDMKPFSDVTDKNAWYYQYVKEGYNNGLIKGYADGTFKPEQTVNTVENLKILLNHTFLRIDTIEEQSILESPFTDVPMDSWYLGYATYAKENNIISGDDQGKIYPSAGMTRGKLAEAIYKVYMADEALDVGTVVVNYDSDKQKFVVGGEGNDIADLPGTFTENDEMAANVNKVINNYAYVSICATGFGGYIMYDFCYGDTYRVNLTTGEVVNADPRTDKTFHLNFMDVTDDGSWTAWTSDEADHKIYLMPAPGNESDNIQIYDVDAKYGQFGDVKFSPDGTKFAYAAIVGQPAEEYSAVYTVDIDSKVQTTVKEGLGGPYKITGWNGNETVVYNDLSDYSPSGM